ncbi:MAG: hypothetical protein R2911_02550 [Caldilineaceae bacterium]
MTLLTLTLLFIGALLSVSLGEPTNTYRPFDKSALLVSQTNRRQRICGLIAFMLCIILILLTSVLT